MNFDFFYLLLVVAIILVSMTLHEAVHAYVSYWLGDDTAKLSGRLTLNPLKHIDPVMTLLLPILLAISGAPIFGGAKPVPFNSNKIKFNEWGIALIALSGPLTNFFIAFVLVGIWALFDTNDSTIYSQILITAASINVGFFVFNMLPFPPLDGSRVLYALAPDFIRRGMEAVEKFGIIIVFIVVMMLGIQLQYLMSTLINFFLQIFAGFFGA